MQMFGIRKKDTGEMIKLFDDVFKARQEVRDKSTQEVVERMVENDYRTSPDGRTYIIGTHSIWLPVNFRSDL